MRPCPSDPWFVVGGFCVVFWTRTLRQGDSNTPQKTTLNIKCGTFMTCAAPKQMRLGPCTCLDDIYVKIIYHFIFEDRHLFYKHQTMFWTFVGFDIVTNIFCRAFRMLYHVRLCSFQPCNLTIIVSSLSLNIQPEKNYQVIKYNLIKTIKRERTFGKVINL